MNFTDYPIDNNYILKKKKFLKRIGLDKKNLIQKNIAIVGGSTIGDIKDILEVFLLDYGIKPDFFIGQYNNFYEDVLFNTQELLDFKPDIIIIHTTSRNLYDENLIEKLKAVWGKIDDLFKVPVIQNNFEIYEPTFSKDTNYINTLNSEIYTYQKKSKNFYVNDISKISSIFGTSNWFNQKDYYMYKYAFAVQAIPFFSFNLAVIIKSIFGKNQKCIVLDLDNTLWGGVVGDLGVSGIELGMETATGEAYITFQKYVKNLHSKGIILAVCSKNDEKLAKKAFENPNMILKLNDISVFYANWDDKANNIIKIADDLNILPESLVFIDDNPAEREIVRQSLPMVKVPEVNNPIEFIQRIEDAGYFYITNLSNEDINRNEYYSKDIERNKLKNLFVDYGEYLKSLNMTSTIKPFEQQHIERITQLINKTNQFNLTTLRYSVAEVEKLCESSNFITFYADLDDKFGNNGIVSVFIGEILDNILHIRLWVMSCRVFKRELELAIFDEIIKKCQEESIQKVNGYYYPTEKNVYVKDLFKDLGFDEVDDSTWEFSTHNYKNKNKYISINNQ